MVVVRERMEMICTVLKRYNGGLAITLSGGKSSKRLHVTQGLYRNSVHSKCQSVVNCDIKLVVNIFRTYVLLVQKLY